MAEGQTTALPGRQTYYGTPHGERCGSDAADGCDDDGRVLRERAVGNATTAILPHAAGLIGLPDAAIAIVSLARCFIGPADARTIVPVTGRFVGPADALARAEQHGAADDTAVATAKGAGGTSAGSNRPAARSAVSLGSSTNSIAPGEDCGAPERTGEQDCSRGSSATAASGSANPRSATADTPAGALSEWRVDDRSAKFHAGASLARGTVANRRFGRHALQRQQ